MKSLLWLLAVAASGALGFYFGIGYGAGTLGAIVAQNEVTEGMARVRASLDALGQSDVERSNHLHELNFKSALFQIGSYSKSVVYWQCSDKDRETMQAARSYAQAHPGVLNGPAQQFESQGLGWCAQPKGGA